MNTCLLTNARIVTPETHFDGSVAIEGGIITDIRKDKYYPKGYDLKGAWLIPGCIDIHAGGFDQSALPGSDPDNSVPLALHNLDARAATCGITTVFNTLCVSGSDHMHGTFDQMLSRARQIEEIKGSLLLRHYLEVRLEAPIRFWRDCLADLVPLDSLYMIVCPGSHSEEGQSLNQQIERLMTEHGYSWEQTRDRLLAQSQEEGESRETGWRTRIRDLFKDRCVVGSCYNATVAHVLEAQASGAVLSEMPLTMAAARKAKELGMWICMEALHYYAGGLHKGTLTCGDAMEEDLVDILCSNGQFPAILGSVMRMIDVGVSPSRAVNMVTLHPARLLGFDKDIGSIAVGLKADLVAFNSERSFASVAALWINGVRRLTADYTGHIQPLRGVRPDRGIVSKSDNPFFPPGG